MIKSISMKKYFTLFKLKFIAGLQYRAAAIAGITTQFFWGFMELMIYFAFYSSAQTFNTVEFSQLVCFIWLRQAFLALFMVWTPDNEIFDAIYNGGLAYELCRPVDLYNIWFFKTIAKRYANVLLRFPIILILAPLLPAPFGLTAPVSMISLVLFAVTIVLSTLITNAILLIIQIATISTLSQKGLFYVVVNIMMFFSGQMVPLMLFPDNARKILEMLPTAYMENLPLRIYSGNIPPEEAVKLIGMQILWIIIIVLSGKILMNRSLKKAVIQGG